MGIHGECWILRNDCLPCELAKDRLRERKWYLEGNQLQNGMTCNSHPDRSVGSQRVGPLPLSHKKPALSPGRAMGNQQMPLQMGEGGLRLVFLAGAVWSEINWFHVPDGVCSVPSTAL